MDVSFALTHGARIAHGIGASLTFAAVVYVSGLALLPNRIDEGEADGFAPAFVGAAVFVIVCWFGVLRNVPVAPLTAGFAAVTAIVALLRRRHVRNHVVRCLNSRSVRNGVLAFALVYGLTYFFTRPPATDEFLPVAWTGNLDLMTYVRYTQYLLTLGPANLPEFSYINYVYLQTPGLFHLLGAFALLFNGDPLSAAMPAQFALTALTGVLIAAISQSVFDVSRRAALVIACIFVSGPFFRYVAANYFLSTLMAMPLLLHVVWRTIDAYGRSAIQPRFLLTCVSAYALLLFIYPFLLLAAIGLQVGIVALLVLAELTRRSARSRQDALVSAAKSACAAMAVMLLIAVVFWSRVMWAWEMVISLSETGIAGWPLDLISPRAMFAWPGTRSGGIQVAANGHGAALAMFIALAIILAVTYFWLARAITTPAQSALTGVLGISIVLYCVYFRSVGASYQQWKFASYSLLPLSFVVYAAALHLLWTVPRFRRLPPSSPDRRLLAALPSFVAVVLIAGNVAVHAAADPPLRALSGRLRGIAEVNRMQGFRDVTVMMNEVPDQLPTWAALYFLPDKRVHVVSSKFEPSEPLDAELISRQRPLLIHNFGCEGVGHQDATWIEGVGCLVFAPPSLQTNVSYPFNQTYLFVSYEGMTGRDPGGRWNTRATLDLKLTADPGRARVDRDLYLNLFVNPFLPPGVGPQRLVFAWPDGTRGEAVVGQQDWFSLPVRTADWVGNRLWTLPITVAFPDGRTILFHELSLTEAPRGAPVARVPATKAE